MSITDELKKWASVEVPHKYGHQLSAIADRIDAEHERRCNEQYACGAEDGISVSIDALVIQTHGFIELPKDRDGEYIHIGDVMEWPTTRETFEVVGIGDGTLFYIDNGSEQADWTGATTKRHYHAPTVEDVLREFANEVYADADNEIRDRDFLCAKYAKRLKLAEGEDE